MTLRALAVQSLVCGLGIFHPALASAQQTWVARSQPVLTIGQLDGRPEYLLHGIRFVLPLDRGGYVIALGSELRFFDERGIYRATGGGTGRGPGEFRSITSVLVLPGDTIVVWDSPLRRVSRFTAMGELIATRTIDLSTFSGDRFGFESPALMPNGSFFADGWDRSARYVERGLVREVMRAAILDPAAQRSTFLGEYVSGLVFRRGAEAQLVVPLAPSHHYAVGTNRVAVGSSESPTVDLFDLRGDRLNTVRVAERPTGVTPSMIDAYYESVARHSTLPRQVRERLIAEVPKPDTLPYYSGLMLDAEDRLWVGDYVIGDEDERGWTIFDASGRRHSRVVLPPRFEPMWSRGMRVLGVWRDEFDVEYVREYELVAR